ncbi:hypothetical protein [Reichenbachiella agariperforans]|uniref:hypothetical protein n=1 Tax=Reichenbachiella agariperforans TaxID=156994 RepID=UPI001C084649|nr:hypothetical protein [Reichenbachiella agariperforans]MBU2915124.1 hypothetical protein [Reichenbachiella agariperforans]
MKKVRLLIALSAFVIFSCTNDDLNNVQITPEIIDRESAGPIDFPEGTFYPGDEIDITWSFLLCLCGDWTASTVHIDLYSSNTYVERIAWNYDFWQQEYSYVVGGYLGDNLSIRVTNAENANEYFNGGNFSVISGTVQHNAEVSKPNSNSCEPEEDDTEIIWDSSEIPNATAVRIEIYKGLSFFKTLKASVENDGSMIHDDYNASMQGKGAFRLKFIPIGGQYEPFWSDSFEVVPPSNCQ